MVHTLQRRDADYAFTMARLHFRYIDLGNVEAMANLFEPNAVYHRPPYEPFVGRASIVWFYTELRTIKSGCHRLDTVVGSGPEYAVRGGFVGTTIHDEPVQLRFADFFLLGPSGLFSRRETFFYSSPF